MDFSCLFLENQAEAKKLEESSLYLNLPATKLELEEKGYSTTGKNTQNLGNCTISKDSFQISTLVCSTKLTQNGNHFYTLISICVFFAFVCLLSFCAFLKLESCFFFTLWFAKRDTASYPQSVQV